MPALSQNKPALLIAAISGRSLAAAARRAGFRPLVADLFNDADTLALAERAVKLAGALQSGIDAHRIVPQLTRLAGDDQPIALIYGSGFERNPAIIDAVAQEFSIAGNSAETIRLVKDPVSLARLCTELRIPRPDIRFDIPDQRQEWLTKIAGGAGGSHVKRADSDASGDGRYFQRFVPGRNLSALFLADRTNAHIVGFSRQWASPSREAPFRYGGAVRLKRYDRKNSGRIEEWLTALTKRTGLCGLCSADFVDSGPNLHLIEINPRPGATLDIFDNETTPLIREHLRAVTGTSVSVPAYADSKASAIAYTARAISAFPRVVWPAQTADHQMPGTSLEAGDPVCTVFATADSATGAMRAVKGRVKELAVHWREDFR
ncbi:ATP-grasp domain-containing protein [Phyllobacterium lublinensis]|uniref:ATP-grasp domain-containing protein n=1 Tax=Phyllobacterium lublinensis TaxID=2875708 RepID=UPI001CCCC6F4|nr:ATP-grasp domain-containing protein [Phyllobacterium sp. 2063]MBZ9657205.1 ATP-grasp domain-containing protein [Phyllobacterium sp. 2063]